MTQVPRAVYAIQFYDGESWQTVDICSYRPDIEKSFQTLQGLTNLGILAELPIRFVAYTVTDLNCIASHMLDFAVESKINY